MTTLRHRVLDGQNAPVAGRVATVAIYDPDVPSGVYRRTKVVSATSGSDGWLSWILPSGSRRDGQPLSYVVSGIETHPVLVTPAAGVSTVTVGESRTGTLPIAEPDETDLVTEDELAARLSGITAGLATTPETNTEKEAFVPARLSDDALKAASVAAGREVFLPRISGRSAPGAAGLPKLMASPPTISAATIGAGSTITDAVLVPALANDAPNTDRFAFGGGPWEQAGTVFPDVDAAVAARLTADLGGMFPYVEFLYYGAAFEFAYKGQGTLDSRVWVDGQLAELVYTVDTAQDGARHRRKVTFTTPEWRRIRIDVGAKFFGVYTGPTDSLSAAPSTGDRLLVIHDSYGEGSGASTYLHGYAPAIGAMLGFNDTISLSQGSTGVLATGSALGRPKYRDRAADWAQVEATHVLIGMSINDDSFSTAALATELHLLLGVVKALPTVREIWVMGRAALNDNDYAWAAERDAPVRDVTEANGARFVSLTEPRSIWSGSGWVGSPAGTGSGDVLWSTDRVHPSSAGHQGIARTFVSRLLADVGA